MSPSRPEGPCRKELKGLPVAATEGERQEKAELDRLSAEREHRQADPAHRAGMARRTSKTEKDLPCPLWRKVAVALAAVAALAPEQGGHGPR
jgi:hypothetical protein